MSVMGCLTVKRAEQIKLADHICGLEGEDGFQRGFDSCFADAARAECIDTNGNGGWVADGIGNLELATVGESGCDDMLGDPAAHIGG